MGLSTVFETPLSIKSQGEPKENHHSLQFHCKFFKPAGWCGKLTPSRLVVKLPGVSGWKPSPCAWMGPVNDEIARVSDSAYSSYLDDLNEPISEKQG
jgi:hypothetical protein